MSPQSNSRPQKRTCCLEGGVAAPDRLPRRSEGTGDDEVVEGRRAPGLFWGTEVGRPPLLSESQLEPSESFCTACGQVSHAWVKRKRSKLMQRTAEDLAPPGLGRQCGRRAQGHAMFCTVKQYSATADWSERRACVLAGDERAAWPCDLLKLSSGQAGMRLPLLEAWLRTLSLGCAGSTLLCELSSLQGLGSRGLNPSMGARGSSSCTVVRPG